MKRCALVLAVALGTACGGGSGSGSGSGAGAQPAGTILGSSFQAVEATSAVPGVTSCQLPPFGTLSVASLAIGFGDHAGLCGLVQTPCARVPNVRTVTVVIARAGSTAQAPIGLGTYRITGSTPTVSTDGTASLATASAERTDASCAAGANAPQATAGSVNVTSVTSASVKGTVDLTFSDGGRLTGPFDAPLCAVNVDVCAQQLPTCPTTPTCNPG